MTPKSTRNLIMHSYRSDKQRTLIFLFFMVFFTSTAIPFRLVPIPLPGLIFRCFIMAAILVLFPFPAEKRSLYSTFYFSALSFFLIWIFISLFYTNSFSVGTTKCLRFLVNVFVPCLILHLIYLSEEDIHRMCSAVLIGAILSVIFAVLTTSDFSSPLGRSEESLSSGITYARSFGLGFLVLFSRTVFSSKHHLYSTVTLIILGVFLLVGIMLTGTRAVMISIVLTIAFLLFLIFIQGRSFKTIVLILLIISIFGYLLVSNPYLKQTAGYRRYTVLYKRLGGSLPHDSSRLQMYTYSYKQFLQKPVIGMGSGGTYSFNLLNFEGVNVSYPHNIFLEIATEFGMIGLSIFGLVLMPCGLVLARVITSRKKLSMMVLPAGPVELGLPIPVKNPAWEIIRGYHENINMTVAMLFLFLFIHTQVSGDIAGNFGFWMMGFILSSLPAHHQGLRIDGRKAFLQYWR